MSRPVVKRWIVAAKNRSVTRRAHAELFGDVPLDAVVYEARWGARCSDVKHGTQRRTLLATTEQPCRISP